MCRINANIASPPVNEKLPDRPRNPLGGNMNLGTESIARYAELVPFVMALGA
jgi:hypothetical protein